MGKLRIDLNDIKNQRFGRMVILGWDHDKIKEYKYGNKRYHYYKCKCDCGNIFIAERNDIKGKKVESCGCLHKEAISADLTDIIKKRFERLVVDEYDHKDEQTGAHFYKCTCDCGNKVVVRRDGLLKGNTRSCGCLKIDSATKHGMSNTRFYKIYLGMKDRCYYPASKNYFYYGGRGIKICDRWLGEDGFIHFKEDMYDSYLKRAEECGGEQYISIDRKDVNGDYCKENCRWATLEEQNNNRRINVRYNQFGDRTLREILNSSTIKRDSRIDDELIRSRLNRGWSLERALTELPAYHNGKKVVKPISFREPHYTSPFTFNNDQEIIYPFRNYNEKE